MELQSTSSYLIQSQDFVADALHSTTPPEEEETPESGQEDNTSEHSGSGEAHDNSGAAAADPPHDSSSNDSTRDESDESVDDDECELVETVKDGETVLAMPDYKLEGKKKIYLDEDGLPMPHGHKVRRFVQTVAGLHSVCPLHIV